MEREKNVLDKMNERIYALERHISVLNKVVDNLMKLQSYLSFELQPFYIQKNGKILGDLMTLEEFSNAVESGAFIDYDGYGRFATKDAESDIEVWPSIFEDLQRYVDPVLDHIIWFNR